MRLCGRVLTRITGMLAVAALALRADPGDVESSHDYAGFPRLPGYVITDYDEDNPAEFDFPVARPTPIDANGIEMFHARGHRYVIRYELGAGVRAPSLFQIQRYYEKLASDAGFMVDKTGAVGDVTETFHRTTATHQIWIYLEPAITVNVLTVMESTGIPPPPPRLSMTPPPPSAAAALMTGAASAPSVDPSDETLYTSLNQNGRVVLPFVFRPGKDELDAASQPLVDRVSAMMKHHPDLFLRIEGHTDNTGDPDENLRLSAQRALAVQAMLVAARIDRGRLDAVGVGGLQPLADNNTAEGRQKNRRIELVLWKRNSPFHSTAPDGANSYHESAAATAAEKSGG